MPKHYTDEMETVQGIEINRHTLMGESIKWWNSWGSLNYNPDDTYSGPAHVEARPDNMLEIYHNGTNNDVGMACVFDY